MTAPTKPATTLTLLSETEIEVRREVAAPRRLVFTAYTSPEHLPHWMLGPPGWSMPICRVDLRPGGAWQFGWRNENGDELNMHGTYVEIDPPARLVTTESWGGDFPETLNTLLLEEHEGRTTIIQQVRYASREARDAALQTGMLDGMEQSYATLDAYLQNLS